MGDINELKIGYIFGLRAGHQHIPYFKSIPWVADIINDPRWTTTPPIKQKVQKSRQDGFFAKTLQTDDTILRCLTVCLKPDYSLSLPVSELMVFFEIESGVAGYPGVCHGGFVATMLDECMGILLNVNQLYKNLHSGVDGPLSHMTGMLNVNYKLPVPTPGIILATAKVSRQEGRKIWIEGTLQDSERRILATSDSLFITTNRSPVAAGKL